jgi:hypothetical protein
VTHVGICDGRLSGRAASQETLGITEVGERLLDGTIPAEGYGDFRERGAAQTDEVGRAQIAV